jgi:hypothetical protein
MDINKGERGEEFVGKEKSHLEGIRIIRDQELSPHRLCHRLKPLLQALRILPFQSFHTHHQPADRIYRDPNGIPFPFHLHGGHITPQSRDPNSFHYPVPSQAGNLPGRFLDRVIHQGLAHKEAQSLQQQRNGPITQAQQVEGNRQSLHPLGKVIPGDPGRINPKGAAAAETPIPPGCDLPMLGVPQRFGDFLHQTEVSPLTSWVRAGLGDLERIWLHRGQTKEQSHLSSSHKHNCLQLYPDFTNR